VTARRRHLNPKDRPASMRDRTLNECAAIARAAAEIPFTDAKAVSACYGIADKIDALRRAT
jgi:hypothetical protein